MPDKDEAFSALRVSLDSYASICEETWQALCAISRYRLLSKGDMLYQLGEIPRSFAYVYKGLLRCYVCDEKGTEYNKNFFDEGRFPGAMTALLTTSPTHVAIEAIENSAIIEIDFAAYRNLMVKQEDLKLFQIYYLEKHWLLAKDARETAIVQEDARARYLRFIDEYPSLVERLPQYHIASHLGVTPTQLSRIRKNLATC